MVVRTTRAERLAVKAGACEEAGVLDASALT